MCMDPGGDIFFAGWIFYVNFEKYGIVGMRCQQSAFGGCFNHSDFNYS